MKVAAPAIIAVAVALILVGVCLWIYIAGKKKKGEL
jgi:cbb3-type cytochrome oxidase subunit 3